MSRLLVLALVVLTACSASSGEDDNVRVTEFSISAPGSLSSGEITFSVENNGEFSHTLVVTDQDGNVVTATDLIEPGSDAVMTIYLEQGTYQFTCRIVFQTEGGTIIDHYQEGMHAEVVVSE